MKNLTLFSLLFLLSTISYGRKFESLEEALKDPSEVDTLVINNSSDVKLMEEKPDDVRMLQNLVYIEFGNVWNESNTIPEVVFELEALEHFQLQFNKYFETIPDKIGNCKNLKTFIINQIGSGTGTPTPIKTLPEEITKCTKLETLVINCSSVTSLPETLGELQNLKVLYFSFEDEKNNISPFSNLPASVVNCSKLESLSLINTSVSSLPDGIENLNNLKQVVIRGARSAWSEKLPVVPFNDMASICKISSLEVIDIACSSVTEIPSSVGGLTKLKDLNIANTRITSIPDEFGNCTSIETVNAIISDISVMPTVLLDMVPNIEGEEILFLVKKGQLKDDKGKELTKDSFMSNYLTGLGVAKGWMAKIQIKK